MTDFDYNQKLTNIDIRVSQAIDFMTEQSKVTVAYSDEQISLMQDAVRELKQASAQLQTVRRNCSEAKHPAQYLADPKVRQVYEVADALAGRVLETAERAEEAVAEYRKSHGPAIV